MVYFYECNFFFAKGGFIKKINFFSDVYDNCLSLRYKIMNVLNLVTKKLNKKIILGRK